MKPPVWRRLVVPSDITLGSLHDVIQVAFGWESMHLHDFEDRAGGRYAPPEDLDIPVFDEEEAALANVLPGTGDRMDYTYDFGDDWLHRITVEAVRPAREGEGEHAVCADGRRGMPPAEDLSGVRGLAGLLERYADGERPSPTLVRHDGEEWAEHDGLHDKVLAGLYDEGFDPVAFDPAELTGELAQVPLRQAVGTKRKRHGGPGRCQVPPGMRRCECGGLHPLPGGTEPDDEVSLSDVLGAVGLRLPAVQLPGEVEPAHAVREVPAFMAAVRLGHWCGGEQGARRASAEGRWRETGGRELTPKRMLWPKLARKALEEAELWRVDPDGWGDAEERTARLAKVRSAADMEPLALPWDWALNCGFVEVEGNRAYDGDELPDQDDNAALLSAWQEAVAGAAVELSLSFTALDELLGGLQPLRELVEEAPPPVVRFRLTTLGRSGLRVLLVAAGVLVPVIGSLAQADARALLAALPAYSSETDVAAEVTGWLAARPAADAAVQVVDACNDTEPADALRRLQAPRVLATVLEADRTGRAKTVLPKAALSKVTGCAHAAASMLRRIDEPAEGEDAWGLERMLVDGALSFVAAGEQLLRERLLAGPEEGRRPLDQLTERADDLWQAGHPHASEVFGALADAAKPVDKALAKRMPKAAFKAGSVK